MKDGQREREKERGLRRRYTEQRDIRGLVEETENVRERGGGGAGGKKEGERIWRQIDMYILKSNKI